MLEYTHDADSNALTFNFTGKLDTTVSIGFKPEIDKILTGLLQPDSGNQLRVVFDFQSVDFITSAFVGICVASAKKAGKQNFSIINTNPFIKRTFKIAGLDGELNVQ